MRCKFAAEKEEDLCFMIPIGSLFGGSFFCLRAAALCPHEIQGVEDHLKADQAHMELKMMEGVEEEHGGKDEREEQHNSLRNRDLPAVEDLIDFISPLAQGYDTPCDAYCDKSLLRLKEDDRTQDQIEKGGPCVNMMGPVEVMHKEVKCSVEKHKTADQLRGIAGDLPGKENQEQTEQGEGIDLSVVSGAAKKAFHEFLLLCLIAGYGQCVRCYL